MAIDVTKFESDQSLIGRGINLPKPKHFSNKKRNLIEIYLLGKRPPNRLCNVDVLDLTCLNEPKSYYVIGMCLMARVK